MHYVTNFVTPRAMLWLVQICIIAPIAVPTIACTFTWSGLHQSSAQWSPKIKHVLFKQSMSRWSRLRSHGVIIAPTIAPVGATFAPCERHIRKNVSSMTWTCWVWRRKEKAQGRALSLTYQFIIITILFVLKVHQIQFQHFTKSANNSKERRRKMIELNEIKSANINTQRGSVMRGKYYYYY